MTYNYIDRAQILVEALPYIQQYSGKTVVVKYGGNAMISEELRQAVMSDITLLRQVGINVVVVHGGGPEINEMLEKLGKEPKFVDGLRYTDKQTMTIVQQVLCGGVNKDLVATLNRMGARAIGLSGLDASLFEAEVKDPKYGMVGEVVSVNAQIVKDALEKGYIPVISTVAQGKDTLNSYNINADIAASKLAIALGAEKLILLTDVRGLLKDPKNEDTLLPIVHVSEVPTLKKLGSIGGGMIPKADCCVEAIRSGVKRCHILDGRLPHSILIEMLTDQGIGTMLI
ncbi:MAG: acetylglutamate kinase [Oscillospiraceae bacterium]|nr:acetylglutamate kinase [Oscillospiraceae bacterium]